MTVSCHHCGRELSSDYRDSRDSEYVAHHSPDGGQRTEYYCNLICVAEGVLENPEADR